MMDEVPESRATDLLAIFSILIIGVLFHAAAIHGWWGTDDPQVLLQAMRDTPFEVLFSPHAYRTLSTSSFTPLVTISFDADLQMAGMTPGFFYLHQIAAALAAAIALYFVGRSLSSRRAGWFAAVFFLVAPTTVDAVRALMLRHYIEGAIAAAVALTLAFSKGRDRPLRLFLAAVFYLLATVEKEFYAPLPLFILAWSVVRREGWFASLRRQIPYAAAAAIYLVWRTFMLGSGGGYGGVAAGALRSLPLKILLALAGGRKRTAMVLLGGFMVLLAVSLLRRPSGTAAVIVAASIFAGLPLLYLAADFDPRYAFAAAVVLAVLAGISTAGSRIGELILIVLLLVVGRAGWLEAHSDALRSRQMVAEGKYVWERPGTAPPLVAGSPGWYLGGLSEIRKARLHSNAPKTFLSLQPFETGEADPAAVLAARGDGSIGKMTSAERDLIALNRLRYRPSAPLSVLFARKRSELRWSVGPAGSFTFVTWPAFDDFPLPPSGWRRIPEPTGPEWFRVRRDDPDGTWTISPTLPLPSDGAQVRWERR